MNAGRTVVLLIAVLSLPIDAAAVAERAVRVDPAASRVTFTLDTTFHEVHGSMAFQAGELRFDPATGSAAGRITVDARTAETGNDKRDKTMHSDVLESQRFPTIEFQIERVDGSIVDPGHSDVHLVGLMRLHGTDHPMTLPASIDSADGRVHAVVRATIPYVEWGLHDPSFLIARTAKTVEIEIDADGRWADRTPAEP